MKNIRASFLLLLLCFLLIIPSGAQNWEPGRLEIHHIFVGQADSTLIIGPTGRTMLVDAGESSWNSHRNADKIADYLLRVLGKREINYFLATHYHADHIGYASYPPKGGIRYLVDNLGVQVDTFIDRGFDDLGTCGGTYKQYRPWAELVQRRIKATEGKMPIDLGPGVIVNVVSINGNGQIRPGDRSKERSPPSENDYSIALKISYGKFDYFIGGDLSGETVRSRFGYTYHDIESSVADKVGMVEALRVNHHGSSHSSNEYFIQTLHPRVSIISTGKNRFGHPDPAVVERLKSVSDVYITGDPQGQPLNGDIIIATMDQESFTVSCRGVDSVAYRCYEAAPMAAALSPTSIIVLHGFIDSGGTEELKTEDGKYLVLRSSLGEDIEGYRSDENYLDWYATIGAPPVIKNLSGLAVVFHGHTSSSQDLRISLWDFHRQCWVPQKSSTIGSADSTLTIDVENPDAFTSRRGTIGVRFLLKSKDPGKVFTLYADTLSIVPVRGIIKKEPRMMRTQPRKQEIPEEDEP